MADRWGDISINSKRYRVDTGSYRGRDVSDFSPKTSTPGGGVVYNEMNLYQPLNQTDWRHGFGFPWHTDASGYFETTGYIDTRQAGLAMLFTSLSTRNSTLRASGGVIGSHDLGYQIYWGSAGMFLRNQTTLTYTGIAPFVGAINQVWTNGSYNFLLPTSGRIMMSNDLSTTTMSASGGGVNYIDDADGGYTEDQYNGMYVELITGAGAGEWKLISDMTPATRITVSTNWTNAPSAGDTYRIWKWKATGATALSVNHLGIVAHDGYAYAWKTNRVYFASEETLGDLYGDPTEDTASFPVGLPGRSIVKAISYAGDLFFARVDGLFKMEKDRTAAKRVLDYTDQISTNNFSSMAVFNGSIIFPIRNQLYSWNGVRVTPITPPRLTDVFPYDAYTNFKKFVVYGNYLLMVAQAGATAQYRDLLAYDGVGWVKLARLTSVANDDVNMMALVTGASISRTSDFLIMDLSIAAGSASGIYNIPFQVNSDLPYAAFPTTGTNNVISSRYDAGFRRVQKSTPSILVEGSNLSAGHYYLKVYYQLNSSGSWTAWGGVDGTSNLVNTNGVTELSNPLGTANSTLEYYWIQLRIDFVTDSASQTPILDGVTIRLLMRPDTQYGYSFNIIGAQNTEYAMGENVERTAYSIVDDLHTARNSKAPVEFTDIWGVQHQAYVTSINEVAVEHHSDEMGAYPNVEQNVAVNVVLVD